jgi:hypothetical protein
MRGAKPPKFLDGFEGGGVLARSGGGGFVSGIGGSSAFSLDPVRIRFGLVP